MKATYESQGSYSYLVYELEPEDIVDTMSLGMITNNKITGLIPVVYTQMDNKRYIKYNITAKVSIRQFFEGIVNKQQVLSIFLGIITSLQAAEEYMIDVGSFLLDMDYIYTDVTVYGAFLICLPVENMKKPLVEFREFFRNIVFSAKFDQAEDSSYVGKLIKFLNSTAGFSLVDFRNLLEELNREKRENVGGTMARPQEIYNVNMQMPAQTTVLPQAASPVPNNIYVQPQTMNTSPMTTQGGNFTQDNVSYPNMPPVNQPQVNPATGVMQVQMPHAQMSQDQNPQAQNPQAQNPASQAAQKEEEKIGLIKLLTHYNKENAQLYKEQKKRDKEEKASEKKIPQKEKKKESKGVKKAKKSKESKTYTTEFAVPGEAQTLQASGAGVRGANAQPDLTTMSSQPAIQQPMMQQSTMQQPMMQQPAMQQPMMQQPAMQQPMMQQPVMQQPMMQQPVMQQSGGNGQRQGNGVAVQGGGMYGGKAHFGETTVLGTGNAGETMVLNVGMQAAKMMPFLIRMKTGESIPVDKPVFRIGKEKSYVDYFINDNTAISRSHANIITREGRYWVVDTNSTNHTYVGGQMIASNTETEIFNGVRLAFANEEFEFRIM